jgi:hypothetical protein
VTGESFDDVLLQPGDEEMVDKAIRDARNAGVTEQEINTVLRTEIRDWFWVPLVAGRLAVLARQRRGRWPRGRLLDLGPGKRG